MTQIKCRDCGTMLEPEVRGCPTCALNFEAERMIDRFVLFVFVPAAVLVAAGAGFLLYRLI